MKVIDAGHSYELDNYEDSRMMQPIRFVNKKPLEDGSRELVHDGTTSEEILAVLINRIYSLQSKFPCKENAIVLINLEESLMWLNKRTENRGKKHMK